jgi:hypothetical protein
MEKHERFRKVAEKRVNQVIMDMNKLVKIASSPSSTIFVFSMKNWTQRRLRMTWAARSFGRHLKES